MASFNIAKYNAMQTDDMLKIYTPDMYQKELDETEVLISELMERLGAEEYEKYVNETEPLATYDYFFGMFTEYFIAGTPIIPVRTIKRVREQIRKTKRKDKIESIVIGILLLVFVVGVLYLNKKMSDSALKSCQAKGNSYVYCINHI